MKEFRIALSRTYLVTIEAESEEEACRYSEYYLGDCPDLSTLQDRKKRRFKIINVEMTENDAVNIEKISQEGKANLTLWNNDKTH